VGPRARGRACARREVGAIADARPFVLKPDATVGDIVDQVRENGFGVVLGDAGEVLGTVDDSAVRRAALEHAHLELPVATVMSGRPLVAEKGDSDERVADLLRSYRVRAVPVVDGGRLVEVRTLDEVPGAGPGTPVAVVMAGGRGQRLRPLTDKVPKPLLRIGATSIVERLISSLATAGVEDVYMAVNYKAGDFEKRLGSGEALGVRLHYVREREPLHTAGALSLLPDTPTGPVIVTNGDIVTTLDFARLLDYHWHHGGAITVAGVEHRTHIPYGVLRSVEHHLLEIDEKPERRDFVSAGIYVLQPEVLRFVPPDTRMGMPDLIADVLAEGLPVHVFPILERWFDIGSPEEFEEVLLQFATGDQE
jgi:dTDP-glucose pyrophosphorylase